MYIQKIQKIEESENTVLNSLIEYMHDLKNLRAEKHELFACLLAELEEKKVELDKIRNSTKIRETTVSKTVENLTNKIKNLSAENDNLRAELARLRYQNVNTPQQEASKVSQNPANAPLKEVIWPRPFRVVLNPRYGNIGHSCWME